MKDIKKSVDCPMCLFSSGFMPFTGNCSQKCSDCNATGKISPSKLKKLKAFYGDLLNT